MDPAKYNYLKLPSIDTWGVIMRKDSPLAAKETVRMEELLELPIITSRQGIREDLPKWFTEKLDQLNIVATFNLAYNAGILAREGLGYVVTFDKIINTGTDSELCFRPLTPKLETPMYLIWKKYQVFSPVAELLLNEMKGHSEQVSDD